ncbi:hypothetical protein TSMG0054 [Halocynthia phage JM-2012]|uniref:hypothetical protein n=1 Tax=Halocynthia phage JM-2012 TaxID=1173297 RepID=UPI00025C690A|nr:hypothetical protein TSMG0054 [Halocynthia phage JM-2012]AFI55337.1 hypothetical protein TSMG0054 [Halocynthia phage JM-2012]
MNDLTNEVSKVLEAATLQTEASRKLTDDIDAKINDIDAKTQEVMGTIESQRTLVAAEVSATVTETITAETNRVVSAADAAALNAGIFQTTTLGLAGTTEGDYFSTPSTTDIEYLILYRHDAGSVATEIKRYPSTDGVLTPENVGGKINCTALAMGYPGTLVMNIKDKTLELTRGLVVLTTSEITVNVPAQVIDFSLIPDSQLGYALYVYLREGSTTINVGTFNSNKPYHKDIVLGVVFYDVAHGPNANIFSITDKYGNRLGTVGARTNPTASYGYSGHLVECNWVTRTLKFTGTVNVMSNGQNVGLPSLTLNFDDYDTVTADDTYLVLTYSRLATNAVNRTESTLRLYSWASLGTTSQIIPASESIVAIFTDGGQVWSNFQLPPINISSRSNNPKGLNTNGSTFETRHSHLLTPDRIIVDLHTKKLTVLTNCYLSAEPNDLTAHKGYKYINSGTVDFSDNDLSVFQTLWYDYRTNKLHVTPATEIISPAYGLIFGTITDGDFIWLGNSKHKPTVIDTEGNVIDYLNGEVTSGLEFDAYENRLLMPDNLFFVEGEELPIFRNSIIANDKPDELDNLNIFITPSTNAKLTRNVRPYQTLDGELYFKPEDLGADGEVASIRMTHILEPDNRYNTPFTIHSVDKTLVSGKVKKALLIGDSLTEVGMASDFKNKMSTKYNCTMEIVGTYASSYTDNIASEGRGYWQYRSFIGKCNRTGATHTLPEPGTTTTSKWQNPFLRLATASDRLNTPELCFTFTGSIKEVSFAEDNSADKYYIFDFAHYLSTHNVDVPDIVTIALSTNDINLQRDSYTADERLEFMELALRHMIGSIRAVSTNIDIGVIPAPVTSHTTNGLVRWGEETTIWIDKCHQVCTDLAVDFIPCYLHVPRDYSNAWNSNVSVPNTMMNKATVTDWVHFDEFGRDMYCNATTAWAVNKLS